MQMAAHELKSDIEFIVRDLKRNDFELTGHARKRMQERCVSRGDIVNVSQTFRKIEKQDSGKIKIMGLDRSGDDLTIICVYESGTLIVTVY